MRLLALDSTTRDGSVALLEVSATDGAVTLVDERLGDSARSHAERLPSELTDLLTAHHFCVADVDLFAVAAGPGSFTGLRIGIATMQGFALATGRPLIGVSALDALARSARFGGPVTTPADGDAGTTVAAWMDAYRRDVFSSLYRRAPDGSLIEQEGPRVDDPMATLTRWRAAGFLPAGFIGTGATLYAAGIASIFPSARVAATPALAAALGSLAAARFARGESPHPAALQPLYVRRPDAELAREKSRTGSS
jgi:tRNA threonylcarbamoyladenosine biosynthesis protein TsaB